MSSIILPVALTTAAAAALVNFWLGMRVGNVRRAERISIGDGGNERLARRMRAQLNFAEYVPLLIILIGLIELAQGATTALWVTGGTLIVARVLHAIGMEGWMPARLIGVLLTLLILLVLSVWAVAIPWFTIASVSVTEVTAPR